jgi:hypothetical protein
MNEQAIAQKLTREGAVTERVATVIDKQSFAKVAKRIEALRGRYEPTSDEAIFLGLVRDMAFAVGREQWNWVKKYALSIQDELMAERELIPE